MIDMRKKNIKIPVFAPSGNLNFFTLSKKKNLLPKNRSNMVEFN